MLTSTLLALAGASLAIAAPDGGHGGGLDVVKDTDLEKQEKALKVSLKEICYRNLYADVAKHKVKYNKEVLVTDDKGKDVFLFDGVKKDSNDKEFYYEDFCYKQCSYKEHNANVAKENTAVVDDSGKGGHGYSKRGFNDYDGLFSLGDWNNGFDGLGGYGGYGSGYGHHDYSRGGYGHGGKFDGGLGGYGGYDGGRNGFGGYSGGYGGKGYDNNYGYNRGGFGGEGGYNGGYDGGFKGDGYGRGFDRGFDGGYYKA